LRLSVRMRIQQLHLGRNDYSEEMTMDLMVQAGGKTMFLGDRVKTIRRSGHILGHSPIEKVVAFPNTSVRKSHVRS
jgi:hypothetical protein